MGLGLGIRVITSIEVYIFMYTSIDVIIFYSIPKPQP